MFKPATKQVAFVKASVYGPQGSGKTTLLAMLAIYLSKTYHNCAPVAWLASEKGIDFVLPFFESEGVPLLESRSRSFLDLRHAAANAKKAEACAVVVDSITHYWKELYTTGMQKNGRRMDKLQRIKEEWEPFAHEFQDSALHFLVSGRMGYRWEEYEIADQNGQIQKELTKEGTKIKAEGDFGHEPDLELEMASVEDPDLLKFERVRGRARRTFKSEVLHVATVKKSRVWALNGKSFTWRDQPGYKPGYFKQVGECFKAHFESINIGGRHHVTDHRPDSSVLFQQGSDQSFHELQIRREIAIQKWDATMELIAPGRKEENIRRRLIIGEAITATRSKTEFERQALPKIENQVSILMALEQCLRSNPARDESDLRVAIDQVSQRARAESELVTCIPPGDGAAQLTAAESGQNAAQTFEIF